LYEKERALTANCATRFTA